MNKELVEALNALEKEKEISKETLFEAIENSLITACKNHFGKADNVKVEINRETGDFLCYAEKEVVATAEEVENYIDENTYEVWDNTSSTWMKQEGKETLRGKAFLQMMSTDFHNR